MKRTSGAALIAALLAGCGGGGGEDTAVSASPPASPPPVAAAPGPAAPSPGIVPVPVPAPVQAPSPFPVPEPTPVPVPVRVPVPVPNPGPVPSAPPAVQVPSVAGAAVVTALTSAYKNRFTSADPLDPFFSLLRSQFQGQTLSQTSAFTAFSGTWYQNEIALSLDAAVGPGALTFTGSGYARKDGQSVNLASAQYSIPAQVSLDRTLHEWAVQGTSSTVRLFVGSIDAKPEWMRVCWRFEVLGVLRVSCTRNLRSDGSPVGADTITDVGGGRTYSHATNDDDPSPRKVHYCNRHESSQSDGEKDTPSFSVLEFSSPNVYKDRALYAVLRNADPFPVYQSTDLGNGTVEEALGHFRSSFVLVRRGNSVESYREGYGFIGYQMSLACSSTNGL